MGVGIGRSNSLAVRYCLAILTFTSCFFWCALVDANQRPHIDLNPVSSNDGLPANWIRAIKKDKRGFVWLGSWEGLIRYDGIDFKTYKNRPGDPTSLSDNVVSIIQEDEDGIFWLGTVNGGVVKFNSKTEVFTSFRHSENHPDSISSNAVVSIFEDSNANLWIGTWEGGLSLFDKKTETFTNYWADLTDDTSISGNSVTSIFEDDGGFIWALTRFNGLNRFDPRTQLFAHYPLIGAVEGSHWGQSIVTKSQDGSHYFVTRNALHKLDATTGQLKQYDKPRNDVVLTGVLEDTSGTLWVHGISKNGALYVFDPTTEAFIDYGIEHEIYVAYQDPDGLIWLGTRGSGIFQFRRPAVVAIDHIHQKNEYEDGYLGSTLGSLYIGSDDNLFIATSDSVTQYNQTSGSFKHFDKKLLSQDGKIALAGLYSMVQDNDNNIWLGGKDAHSEQGLIRLDPLTNSVKSYTHDPNDNSSLSSDIVMAALNDSKGQLWFGSDNGLNLYNAEKDSFQRFFPSGSSSESPQNNIRTVYESKDGLLWLGSWHSGIKIFNPESKTFQTFDISSALHIENIGATAVYSIVEDDDGLIWVGTANGLVIYNRDTTQARRYSSSSGLPSDAVFGVVPIDVHNNWVITRRGLVLFDKVADTFLLFDNHDGVTNGEYLEDAFAVDSTGTAYFGSSKGVDVIPIIRPDVEVAANQPAITSVFINHKEIDGLSDAKNWTAPWSAKDIEIPSGKHAFGFMLSPMVYSAAKKIKYRYRLEPLQSEWIEVDTSQRYVSYPNVRPGEYSFLLSASDSAGKWNTSNPQKIRITVRPSWWQTWWWYTLVALILLSSFTAYMLVRKRNAVERGLIQEKIRHSEETMRLLLGSTSEAFFGTDPHGICIFSNLACERILKCTDGRGLLNQNMEQYFVDIADDEVLLGFSESDKFKPMNLCTQTMESFTKFRNTEGREFPVSYSVQPLFVEDKRIGSVVRFVDATESLANIRASRRHQRMEIFGQLIDGIAHDFNNHLSVIGLSLGMLTELSDDDKEVKKLLSHIGTSLDSASTLSNKLVSLSDTHEPVLKVIDLNSIVGTVEHLMVTTLGEQIELELALHNAPLYCKLDREQLRNSLLNVLINARDAIMDNQSKGGHAGKVRITTGIQYIQYDHTLNGVLVDHVVPDAYVYVSVEDTGSGIAEGMIEKMIEPFYTSKATGKGSGLGLAIVNSFVEQANGFLQINNIEQPNKQGAKFTLYFPKHELLDKLEIDSPEALTDMLELLKGDQEKVLVVEDYEANLEITSELLRQQNYEVYCAKTVHEARQIFNDLPDLQFMITDIVLPSKMDGRDLYTEFKSERTNFRAVFISGYARKRYIENLDDVPWLKKPVSPKHLVAEVKRGVDLAYKY